MASSTGKVNWKVAPRSGLPVAHNPRCASIIERLSDRPMPVPWGFVVKNGSKTLSARSGGNPMPVSLTEISTKSSGFRCDLIVRCAEPPLKPRVNQNRQGPTVFETAAHKNSSTGTPTGPKCLIVLTWYGVSLLNTLSCFTALPRTPRYTLLRLFHPEFL